jgi:hypothetical protein
MILGYVLMQAFSYITMWIDQAEASAVAGILPGDVLQQGRFSSTSLPDEVCVQQPGIGIKAKRRWGVISAIG